VQLHQIFFAFVSNHGEHASLGWYQFYKFCQDDISRATSLASAFMVVMMNDKVGLTSIKQTIRHYEIAFDNWQIGLNEATKKEIKHRSTQFRSIHI